VEDYRSNVFTGPRREGYEHNIAADYTRQAADLEQMDVAEIWSRYSQELARAVRCYEHQAEVAQRFIDLHKRHAATVCAVLREQVAAHSAEFVARAVDRSSLIGMVGRQVHTGQIDIGAGAADSELIGPTVSADTVLVIRETSYQARLHGNPLDMPRRAFQLLVVLARRLVKGDDGWVTRRMIYDQLWPDANDSGMVYDRQIDDTVRELRRSFDDRETGLGMRLVETKPRVGYRLKLSPREVALL
jgi:DNA-binding response OmpR family regulator